MLNLVLFETLPRYFSTTVYASGILGKCIYLLELSLNLVCNNPAER